ncbi:MAG: hypothetical protein ABI273_11475 [Lacunisphaera sp.]
MPKVQRKDIPGALFAHLLLRIAERCIDADALNPSPLDMTFYGNGTLVKTFLKPGRVPIGQVP